MGNEEAITHPVGCGFVNKEVRCVCEMKGRIAVEFPHRVNRGLVWVEFEPPVLLDQPKMNWFFNRLRAHARHARRLATCNQPQKTKTVGYEWPFGAKVQTAFLSLPC